MDKSAILGRSICGALMLCGMAGLAACGGTAVGQAEEVAVSQGALTSEEWTNGWDSLEFEDGSPMISETKPVACEAQYDSGAGGQAIFKTDLNGHVQMTWKSYSPWAPWTTIGNANLVFQLPPACAPLDGAFDSTGSRNQQIAVVPGETASGSTGSLSGGLGQRALSA